MDEAGQTVRRLAEAPPPGEFREVEPGIFWLRLSLPFALDHVNAWLVDDQHSWTLIDTGYGDAPTRAVWEGLLGRHLAGKPVARVLATHFHPDHLGQAGWLCERTGADLVMTRTEWLTARMLALDDTGDFLDIGEAHWRRAAMPEAAIARQRARGNAYRRGITAPPGRFVRLEAGDEIDLGGSSWRVLIGEGHAPEQVTLHCAERGVLIAADQILPRISPVVGVWASQPAADPLGDFLRSLRQYRDLPEATRVLPSHREPFTGLHARLGELALHHEQRLARVHDACAGEATTAEIAAALFPRALDSHQEGFALGETLAHLNRLERLGEIDRHDVGDAPTRWRRR